jgi:hypothetical protein
MDILAAKVGMGAEKATLSLITLVAYNRDHASQGKPTVYSIDHEGDAMNIYKFLFDNLPQTTLQKLANRMRILA